MAGPSPTEHEQPKVQLPPTLRQSLSLFNVVAMLISITGHIAVFITPGSILAMSGSIMSTLFIWCIGTFFVYTLALCFTELGTVFQKAGGPYLYIASTFGRLSGFLIAWAYVILISGPFIAFASQTAAVYIVKAVLPSNSCQSHWQYISVQLLAIWLLVTLAYLNCVYLQLVVRIQSFLTLCKIIALGIIIIAAMYLLSTSSTENFEKPFEGSHMDFGKISMAIIYVIFSNGGWQSVTTLTEEVKDPARTLPRAIHITFAVNLILMLLTYVSYMVVLEKNEMIETKAIAIVFCLHIWTPLIPLISILVALACIGALNTGIMGHSRVLLAAARKGDMPSILSTLHPRHRTPMMSVMAVSIYGFVMMFSGGTLQLMQFIGLCSLIMGLKVVSALLYLRYTKPKLERPYKVPLLFPILQVVVCLSLLVLIIYQEPVWMGYGVLIYLAGIPIYFVFVRWKKPKPYVKLVGQVTCVLQKIFKQVPS